METTDINPLIVSENTNRVYETVSSNLQGADLTYFKGIFGKEETGFLFDSIFSGTGWQQEKIRIFGKTVQVPRLTAWHGDPGITYSYSGLNLEPSPWTPALLTIKNRIKSLVNSEFNSVLLNLYRDGNDSVSWHSDDEKELGRNPVIASVSLGGTRNFRLKHKFIKKRAHTIPVEDGSLLVMKGETQHNWMHCIPKSRKMCDPRINLTFRMIHH